MGVSIGERLLCRATEYAAREERFWRIYPAMSAKYAAGLPHDGELPAMPSRLIPQYAPAWMPHFPNEAPLGRREIQIPDDAASVPLRSGLADRRADTRFSLPRSDEAFSGPDSPNLY